MNISAKKIIQAYESNIWNADIENCFYEMWNQPTNDFFNEVKRMISEQKNDKFTEEGLRLIGFYTHFLTDEQKELVVELLQSIISERKSGSSVIEQAILQLGSFGSWPDLTLRSILQNEPNRGLRVLAFQAVLMQLKLPHEVIGLEAELAINGDIEPSFARIEQVTQARADGHFDHLQS